ncbi:MAG: DUF4215 domain-containing protein [Nannocystaceae bacterium]
MKSSIVLILALAACHIPGPLPFSTGPELPNCGDLVVDPGEICDDGSRNDNDVGDCTEHCTLPYCGDGLVHQPTEQCDLGSENAEQSPCLPDCTLPATCGDAIVHPLESCDLGTENSDVAYGIPGCSTLCHLIPYCGDGNLDEPYEICDDGNQNNNDACTNECQLNVCGDGFRYEGNEDCDDSNSSNQDACLNDCSLASCGDGFVHSGVEECDGASDCGPKCFRDRYVFTTWESFHGNFDEGLGETGIERADWLCRTRAEVEKLHLGATYYAWVSDDTTSPSTRFDKNPGRYVFPDGTVFAESWEDLVQGNLMHPPNTTENGEEPDQGIAWSNTLADGTAASNDQHCNHWSSKQPDDDGRIGGTSLEDASWADYDFASPLPCDVSLHLYCFEQ